MTAKRLAVAAALVFVLASIAALAVREYKAAGQGAAAPAAAAAPSDNSRKTIAYFFHSNTRCATCDAIEAYTLETLENRFAGELNSGRIEWRVANYEEPENAHFQEDFELIASSVVLVDVRDGAQGEFKELAKVWMLADDKEAFLDYVESEVTAFLAKAG